MVRRVVRLEEGLLNLGPSYFFLLRLVLMNYDLDGFGLFFLFLRLLSSRPREAEASGAVAASSKTVS